MALADPRRRAMAASLAVAVLMLVGKSAAAALTGSAAILSDAAESVVHILATGIAAYSLWFASLPADRDHPYGHGKIAYFSAGFEGLLITGAALAIMAISVEALLTGPQLQHLGWGVAITGALALTNLALGLYLVRVGKRHHALVVEANGHHVLTDVWTSGAVVLGVLMVVVTGWLWLDPAIAIVAAINILWTGGKLLKTSFHGLMEQVPASASAELVSALAQACRDGLIADYHQVRHRRVGDQVLIEWHALVPGTMSVTEAHDRVCLVEERLRGLFPDERVLVTTHVEPQEHHHPEGHPDFPDPLREERLER